MDIIQRFSSARAHEGYDHDHENENEMKKERLLAYRWHHKDDYHRTSTCEAVLALGPWAQSRRFQASRTPLVSWRLGVVVWM